MTFLQWTCHIFLPFSFLGLDVSRGSLKRPIPSVIIQKKKDFLKVFIFFPQGTDLTNRSPEIQILIGKRKEGVGEVFERRWARCQGVIFSMARSTHALSQQSQRNLGDRGWGSIKMVNRANKSIAVSGTRVEQNSTHYNHSVPAALLSSVPVWFFLPSPQQAS